MAIQEALSRPIGPLAAWQWGLVIGGGYIGYRLLTGKSAFGGGGSGNTPVTTAPGDINFTQGPEGAPGPVGPSGPTGGIGVAPVQEFLLTITKKTPIRNTAGTIIGYLSSGSYYTTREKINGYWHYVIISGSKIGQEFWGTKGSFFTVTPVTTASAVGGTTSTPTAVSNAVSAPSTTAENQLGKLTMFPNLTSGPTIDGATQVRSSTLTV